MGLTQSLHARAVTFMELNIVVIATLAGEIATKTEIATPDEILILWCVVGSMIGSWCSLHFYPPITRCAAGMQFSVNFSLGIVFSPLLVDFVGRWTGIPIGLRLALPVSAVVGIIACASVARMLPWVQRLIDKRGQKAVDDIH